MQFLKNNLKPVFVDVNLDDYNVCIDDFKKKLSKKIKSYNHGPYLWISIKY